MKPIPWKIRPLRVFHEGGFEKDADWKVLRGSVERSKEALVLKAPDTEVRFGHFDWTYKHRMGGDVEYRFRFHVQPEGDAFRFRIAANRYRVWGLGFSLDEYLEINDKGTLVAGVQHVTARSDVRLEPGRTYTLRFINLGRWKQVILDDATLVDTWIHTEFVSSEGDVHLEVTNGSLILEEFGITDLGPDIERREYARGKVLFEDECATRDSQENWVYEHKKREGTFPPLIEDGWLTVERLSAVWCRYRAEGPVLISFDYRPVPGKEGPEDITDAIFMFMAEWTNWPFDFFGKQHYNRENSVIRDMDQYWIDWGGNDNQTTRLRRSPFRQLLRQSLDGKDMLKPDHTHKVEILAAGHDVRLHVDGQPVLEYWDPSPLTHGHFGMLGFVRGSKLRNFRIYRAAEK